MTKKSVAHLKLHVEDLPPGAPTLADADLPQLAALCRAFEQTTGWQLRHELAQGGLGESWSAPIAGGGRLVMTAGQSDDDRPAVELAQARPLALTLASLLGEVNRLRRALWEREAELAAGVPVSSRPDEEPHLAERLEAVLKGGAEAVGCPAAALYLLDETTTTLKLRAAYGLPQERLLAAARPLRGSVADLEALVGHAVVLEDTSLLPHWRCPEDYPAAVCVPVSSPTTPLGTLWVFSKEQRDFAPEETNLIEIVAGRLAADLEREMLLVAGVESKQRDRQFEVAQRWQNDRLPSVTPIIEDYEVAGWTCQAAGVGGDFHDWSVLPDGRLACVVGDAHGALLEAGFNAAALQAAVRAHTGYRHDAAQLLARVNDTLWTGSAGDQFAGLFYALIEPATGVLEFAHAGNLAAILLGGADNPREVLGGQSPPLGADCQTKFKCDHRVLAPGDVLILLSEGTRNAVDEAGLRIGEGAIASLVSKHERQSAEQIVSRLRRLLDRHGQSPEDMTVLVVKRKSG
ncbi:MAG: SpoIIE family protein phosphatase [Planctomycetaceae bacterium]|nr:SpoIIE family protein phosphatase [Planctomycetaceae bacterium]